MALYDPDRHHRRSIRLRGHDYAQAGLYFITLCVQDRACLFGDVVDSEMILSEMGRIVEAEWLHTAELRSYVFLDAYVVMPNHFHAIIALGADPTGTPVGATHRVARPQSATAPRNSQSEPGDPVGRPYDGAARRPNGPVPGSLAAIIAQFKAASTKQINRLRATPGTPVWQRNYYEHIVRSERSLEQLQSYIYNNPAQWATDKLHPDVPSSW